MDGQMDQVMEEERKRDSIGTSAIRSSSSGPSALPNLRPPSRHTPGFVDGPRLPAEASRLSEPMAISIPTTAFLISRSKVMLADGTRVCTML